MIDATALPWTLPTRRRLAEAWAGPRFPHALLLAGRPGTGAEALADWVARLVLCDDPGTDPCGHCASCQLYAAGSHPDLVRIGIEEDASYIKIEQIRALTEWGGLKSYRGRRKVALIEPADRLVFNAYNALLKTLEEPTDSVVLVLVATRLERLPRTILSRCQRLDAGVPERAAALAWLQEREPGRDWGPLLDLAAGAPLEALAHARAGMDEVERDLVGFLAEAGTGRLDVLKAAAAWAGDRPFERLVWLEHWALAAARRALLANGDGVDNNRMPSLPSPAGPLKIRSCLEFAEQVRDARNLLQGSLNTQLLLEGVALRAAELMRAPAARERAG